MLVVVEVAVEGRDAAVRDQPEFVTYRAQQGAVVTDQHHRPFKLIESHGERLACGQVKVIGRFVEQQQVGALPDDHGQYQPRLFSAGERADRLLDHVAGKVERAEEVAQILFACRFTFGLHFFRQPGQVFERVVLRTQHIEFLLGEVADGQSLALGQSAAERCQGAGDGLDQR